MSDSEELKPDDWLKISFLVKPDGASYSIQGGDRASGDGDMPYLGLEPLKKALCLPRPSVSKEPCGELVRHNCDCCGAEKQTVVFKHCRTCKSDYQDKDCHDLQAAISALQSSIDVDDLAQFIREIDGNNSIGAGALAEAIAYKFQSIQPSRGVVIDFGDLVALFNQGYAYGHHDTVEGQYSDFTHSEERDHQSDIVAEIILESFPNFEQALEDYNHG